MNAILWIVIWIFLISAGKLNNSIL